MDLSRYEKPEMMLPPQFIMACLLFSTEDRKAAVSQSARQMVLREK